MIKVNPERSEALVGVLAALWEESVRNSHDFLTEADIDKLIPFIKAGLSGIEKLIVFYDGDIPLAFMGIDSFKIEMLFVLPACFGIGLGTKLVKLAVGEYGVKYVDVNEQNAKAAGFYRHMGFEAFCRTEHDGQGNPFPILKMELSL